MCSECGQTLWSIPSLLSNSKLIDGPHLQYSPVSHMNRKEQGKEDIQEKWVIATSQNKNK